MSCAGKNGISRPKNGKNENGRKNSHVVFPPVFTFIKNGKIKNDQDDRQYDFKWVKCKNWDGTEQDFYLIDRFHP